MTEPTIQELRTDLEAAEFLRINRQLAYDEVACLPWTIDGWRLMTIRRALLESADVMVNNCRGKLIRASLSA